MILSKLTLNQLKYAWLMKTRVYSLLLEYHKENDIDFVKNDGRFRFCENKKCSECNVNVKCTSLGGNVYPSVSKAQMNKFKLQFPEEFI